MLISEIRRISLTSLTKIAVGGEAFLFGKSVCQGFKKRANMRRIVLFIGLYNVKSNGSFDNQPAEYSSRKEKPYEIKKFLLSRRN